MLSSVRKFIAGRREGGRLTTYRDRYRIAAALSFAGLPLSRILALFGSDKDRPGEHSYGATYQELFGRMRLKRIKILEIGLLSGASVLAWRCFFPFATTIGIDIEPKEYMAGDRTRIYRVDQGSEQQLADLCAKEAPFDIIIDDGSHFNHHQLFSFRHLFPHLKVGGLYVIEDVQTSFWADTRIGIQWDGAHIDQPAFRQTCVGTFLELSKYLNHMEFTSDAGLDPALLALGRQIGRIAFEHNVVMIWKRPNVQASNVIHQG